MATNKITVTNFDYNMAGTADFKIGPTLTRPTNWNTYSFPGSSTMYANGYLYYIPQSSGYTGEITSILRCSITNFDTVGNWTTVATPAFEHTSGSSGTPFAHITGTDTLMLRSGSSPASNKVIISTDNGATWNYTSANLPTTIAQYSIAYGHNRVVLTTGSYPINLYYTDDTGTSWNLANTGITGSSYYMLLPVPSVSNTWLIMTFVGSYVKVYRNTGNCSSGSWTEVFSMYCNSLSIEILYHSGTVYLFIFPTLGAGFGEPYYVKSLDGGLTWSGRIYCSRFRNIMGDPRFHIWKGSFLCASSTNINGDGKSNGALYANRGSPDFRRYLTCPDVTGAIIGNQLITGNVYSTNYANREVVDLFDEGAIGVPYTVLTSSNPVIYYLNNLKNSEIAGSSYVEVTATKGSTEQVLRLPVKLADVTSDDVYTLQIYPSVLNLMATLDGYVYSGEYANAKVTATVWKNGVDVTNLFYFERSTTTGLTVTSTGSTTTVTALANTYNSGTITISALYQGVSLTNTALVVKVSRDSMSGYQHGSNYSAFTATATSIYIKFKPNGQFQIKRGAGAYVDAGIWYNPVNNTTYPGNSTYMTINYTSDTSDTLQAGTNGAIIGNTTGSLINVEREFYLSNAATGSHRVYLTVRLAPTSNMSAAVQGSGTLELVVP